MCFDYFCPALRLSLSQSLAMAGRLLTVLCLVSSAAALPLLFDSMVDSMAESMAESTHAGAEEEEAAAGSHVMSVQQLSPETSMTMPMMMPMPLTTALQNHMKKSMQAMTSFVSQLQMMPIPSLPSMSSSSSMHSMPSAMHSPCGGGGGSSAPAASPAADLMTMLQQLTQQLNPLNLLNSISSMLKGTQMAMGMGAARMPCAPAGD